MTTEIKLPPYTGGYRYLMVEADYVATSIGFQQRPAADRRAEVWSYGIYDMKEGRLIVEPNPIGRLEILRGKVESARRDIDGWQATIDAIRRIGRV